MRADGGSITHSDRRQHVSIANEMAPSDDVALMARFGIINTSVDEFRYKRYLYSKLSDAVAQARRDHPSA